MTTEQKLAELTKLATDANAIVELWSAVAGYVEDGGQAAFCRDHQCDDSEGQGDQNEVERAEIDAAFVDAANPAVVLALVEVAKAARQLRQHVVNKGNFDDDAAVDPLDSALANLEAALGSK